MKKIKAILSILFTTALLSGCYDMREIDETAYIIALGVDSHSPASYTYTFQLANPLEMTSGGEETEGKSANSSVQNFVVASPDFYTAKNQLNNFLSKNVDMSHLKLIVFSKELDNNGFLRHSQFLMHEREVRPHTNVAVSDQKAEDFIKSVKPTLEANTAKYYELMGLRSDNLYAPSVTISSFLDSLSTDTSVAALPIAYSDVSAKNISENTDSLWVSSNSTQISEQGAAMEGMAIFKKGRIISLMDSDSALIMNILSGKINTCTVTLKNPAEENSKLIFRLNIPKSAEYDIAVVDNQYVIHISQPLDIEFMGSFLPEGFKTETELYNYSRQTVNQKIEDFVYDLSRNKKADILNIGDKVKSQLEFSNQWQNIFETAKYAVNIY